MNENTGICENNNKCGQITVNQAKEYKPLEKISSTSQEEQKVAIAFEERTVRGFKE